MVFILYHLITELYFKLVLQKATKSWVSPGVQIGNTPKYPKVIFYPELWTVEEIEDWGRSKVLEGALDV